MGSVCSKETSGQDVADVEIKVLNLTSSPKACRSAYLDVVICSVNTLASLLVSVLGF